MGTSFRPFHTAWVGDSALSSQPSRNVLGWRLAAVVLASGLLSCAAQPSSAPSAPVVRWLKPSETAVEGRAPGAKSRLVSTEPDGTKNYVLVLSVGDQVQAAIAAFAKDQHVVDAHFSAIGAVREAEVAWFDESRRQFKAMSLHEQMEVLTLSGDISLSTDGQPVVHTHLVLGRSEGEARGGHLIEATVSPTLELYATTYPAPLYKRLDPRTDLQIIDPSVER
jgi:predicted DNA-binding protein with PD1-like motif